MATAVACLTVAPLAYHATAHAAGPGAGAAARHEHGPAARDGDHRPGRQDGRRPAAQDRGRHRDHEPAVPRTRIIFDAKSPRGPVVPGGTYQFPYTVTNPGPRPARDVALNARPDRHLKVVATPPRCRWTSHNNLVCRIGLIPGGETRKGAFTAKVDKNAPAGRQLSDPVRLSWNGQPDREARYSGFPPVTVSPASAQATDLAVTSTVPQIVGKSGDIPYEVSVTNEGPVTAEGVVVRSAVADQPPGSPCAVLLAPAGGLVGEAGTVKPELPPCAAGQDRSAGPAAAPQCGAVPSLNADRPVILPCTVSGAGKTAEQAVPSCLLPHPADQPPPCAARPDEAAPAAPPCAVADKPLAHEGAGRPACAPPEARTAAGPGKNVPTTPESGRIVPGMPPVHDVPAVIGHGRHHCVSEGAGFVCPVGSIPPGRTRTLRLAVHARPDVPHRLRCLSSVASGTPDRDPANNSVDCHTRAAHPMVPHQNLAVHRLPQTGFAYGLLGLCGAGLTGVGFVLYRVGRARRGRARQAAIR